MKRRLKRIPVSDVFNSYIGMNKEVMRQMLDQLPDDVHFVSADRNISTACWYLIVESKAFDEIDSFSIVPELRINYTPAYGNRQAIAKNSCNCGRDYTGIYKHLDWCEAVKP